MYQEYIQDKHHLHMNSTRWVTLTEFVKHLGRTGVARVDETEKGWFISWIDNSPKALAKQEASMKKERATMSDEARERMLIEEQIERAAQEGEGNGESKSASPPVEEGLKREEGEKVVLSFGAKPTTSTVSTSDTNSPSGGLKLNAFKPAVNPLKAGANPLKAGANPLKRPNVFKQATPSQVSSDDKSSMKRKDTPMSAAERLIVEDQNRKRRRMEQEGVSAA